MSAYSQGFACGRRTLTGWLGLGSARNPYVRGTQFWSWWELGFADSRRGERQ